MSSIARLRPVLLLASLALFAPCAAHAQAAGDSGQVGTTVSVPLNDNDTLNVTGPLAIRHRGKLQFLVIESPTPYRLHPTGAGTAHTIRDIAFTLPDQPAGETKFRSVDLTTFIGQTLTASGHVHFGPAASTWNGANLETSVIVLPGGRELRSRR